MPQPLTLVKIINCVLNGADGVTQVSIVGSSVFCVDSCRLGDDELLFFHNNFVVPSQKNLFRSAMSFANYQREGLSEQIKAAHRCRYPRTSTCYDDNHS